MQGKCEQGDDQCTLAETVKLKGKGIHTGEIVDMQLHPAEAHHGIVFQRSDIKSPDNHIVADAFSVSETRLATSLKNEAGISVMTVEHLMSALYALNIDNVRIELTKKEVPIFDGSALPFTEAVLKAGFKTQTEKRRKIKVIKPFIYREGDKWAGFFPGEGMQIKAAIEFKDSLIGRQEFSFDLTPKAYCQSIAPARTFALKKDVEALQKAGFAKGGSLENAVIVDHDRIINPEGLRFEDEFIRHKILDIIGDISLMNAHWEGVFKAEKSGHDLNNKALRAFLSETSYWYYL